MIERLRGRDNVKLGSKIAKSGYKLKFEIEYFNSSNKEPIANWIDSNKKFGDYSVKLDGESFNGEAVYSELRRDTNTWRSFFRYTGISPTFRADNGFIVENDLKRYELCHGFYKYPDKKILRNYRISARYDLSLIHI